MNIRHVSCLSWQTGFPLWTGTHAHHDDITCVILDPERGLAISTSFDRDILAWDMKAWAAVVNPRCAQGPYAPTAARLRDGGVSVE
jgi:hypothetical protein